MFDPVDPKQALPDLEKGILQYWKEEGTFPRSVHERPASETFSFYDGPPFATGLPHYGHLIGGTIKDVIPRYQTMRGKRVERRFGWDCHGLPIEALIEKEQGLKNKREIEEMGVAKFNALCRASVQRYTKEWRTTVERIGRWVDMDYDYRTMDPEYMESIWWVFKQVHDKGLMYEGHKPMHVCPRCVTPLSNFEVSQGYKDVTDQSVTAMFAVVEDGAKKRATGKAAKGAKNKSAAPSATGASGKTYFLAWTTTPWTLPGNLFLAVHPEVTYVTVESSGAQYIVAKELVERVFQDREHRVSGKGKKGKSLVGMHYVPLFPYFRQGYEDTAFRVVAGEFVTTEDGTGVVHIAPGFGEDDYNVGKQEGVPLLQHVSMDGKFTGHVADFKDEDVKPADDPMKTDRKIADWLERQGRLFAKETYRHSYPHCWRCDSPLLNYATSSWFIAVEKVKEKMLVNAKKTAWVPAHVRDGRFGKWLENARDWAISRNRYWGTPLPIWRLPDGSQTQVIGGRGDLMEHHKIRFTKVTVLRHAQSENNVHQLYEGELPGSSLSPLGKKQALAVAELLQRETVDVIYSSPLARARETAQAIADKTGARVIVDERLRELSFGEHEGKHYDFSDLAFLKAQRTHLLAQATSESIYHLPGMEGQASVYARMASFFTDILPGHRSDHVVIVTHADPLLHVRRFFTEQPHEKLAAQPIARHAEPFLFYYDHDTHAQIDLHKEIVDAVRWTGGSANGTALLVRHGETEWNVAERVQGGNSDSPLHARGKETLARLAEKLKTERFDAVVTSDLGRSVESARILCEALELPNAVQWKELRERDAGEWSGQTKDEIFARYPTAVPGVNVSLHYASGEKGESLSKFLRRMEKSYERLATEFAGKRVLVVTHAGCVRALSAIADNLSYAEAATMEVKNADAFELALRPLASRVPEVLDCWFESGSMPYAQVHYPFESEERRVMAGKLATEAALPLPFGFPADFIAEGIDQTRLWFYTLMVLGTILFDDAPYRNVVVNGIVLADDGRKMSKRLKNYPDPMMVVEKYGADALRFALMSSPAVRGEDLRFSEKVVEEALRSVLLPLWNAYSFFVTYANASHFEPVAVAHVSDHPLDRAIRIEVQDLVNRMTAQMDRYDLSATCSELHDTLDALTNWYIRLSRRRFAGKGTHEESDVESLDHEGDQQNALTTLYEVLLTMSRLLAPFCPFVTEAIYLNLAPQEHGSVHLTRWPDARKLTEEEQAVLAKTRVLRQLVSLGLTVRSEQKIKLRCPLAKLTAAVPPHMLRDADLTDADIALLRQEVNVKEIAFVDDPGILGTAIAQVDARKVGPKLGGKVQDIIARGKRGEFERRLDGSVLIGDEALDPDEVTILYREREGENVAAEGGIVVSLDTRITPALQREGEARELIRAIQSLRKERGLSITDRITLSLEGADDLLETFGDRLARETNAVLGKAAGEAQTVELDGRTVSVRFAA